ncbi:MAG: deoxyribodipyrimidine photo-lyase [Gammaproteobacteria bacterium]|jgi:deoxyribodipyrimidine photo-lyase
MRALYWIRNDLRINDNTALFHAVEQSKEGMIAVFFVTHELWRKRNYGRNKIDFILANLQNLVDNLKTLNISVLIQSATTEKEIEDKLTKIMQKFKCDSLFYNRRYELQDIKLEERIKRQFAKHKLEVFSYDDECILSPGIIKNKEDKCYSIFTPFKKQWIKIFQQQQLKSLAKPRKQKKLIKIPKNSLKITTKENPFWASGEKQAQRRLELFIENNIKDYAKKRDFPAINGTSNLSPYLAVGVISARQCLFAAMKANHNRLDKGNAGISTWISELIWRDFYKHLIFGFPFLCQHQPFKSYTDKISWKTNKKLFNAWKNGKTGYPIIDAAMQQLNQTGWMHNRLRMLVASFLTKILLIDWRLGEKYFAEHLIDYDFAANNGGWQWSASTGADCMPYFRVFNPMIQSKKYDPSGEFIKKYLPEYKNAAIKQIHSPQKNAIVEYKAAKNQVINAFKKANKLN